MSTKQISFQSVSSSPLYSAYASAASNLTLSIATKKKAKMNWETQPSRLRPYMIGDQIGGNEMSKIYSAIHCVNYHLAAIKMIPLRKLHKAFYYGQQIMHAETVLAPLLFHPFITPIYETIHSKTHLMQIMELLENGNLFDLLVSILENRAEKIQVNDQITEQKVDEEKYSIDDKNCENAADAIYELTYEQKLNFIDQILSAVEYLHSHYICHRDIKLDNILLNKDMTVVKLCDFGFSAISLPGKPVSGLFGSYDYAAPEVLENRRPYDGCVSDMWSLGVLIFVTFAERFPFSTEDECESAQEADENENNNCNSNLNENCNLNLNDNCNSNLNENCGNVSQSASRCSISSFSSFSSLRSGTIPKQPSSVDCFKIDNYFEEAVANIDYTGIPDQIVAIIKSLLVIDPKKRATCHQVRMNPVFNTLKNRIFNKIDEQVGKNEPYRFKLRPIPESEALLIVVRRIAELKNKTIIKAMSNLKSPDENEEKVLYRLIKNIIDLEGYFAPSSKNANYIKSYEDSFSTSPSYMQHLHERGRSNSTKVQSKTENSALIDSSQKVDTETSPIRKRRARKSYTQFSIIRSNSFSTLGNFEEEESMSNSNNSYLTQYFRSIEELKYSEILTVFGDPAKIMNDIDSYLIGNYFSVSSNSVGMRKAVALSEDDEKIIITIELLNNSSGLDPMLYYDVKLVSKTGKKEDFEDVAFFIKSRFALPILT